MRETGKPIYLKRREQFKRFGKSSKCFCINLANQCYGYRFALFKHRVSSSHAALQFWLPVFFVFNFVWPALWFCSWLYEKSKPLFYKIQKISVKFKKIFKFCSRTPSPSTSSDDSRGKDDSRLIIVTRFLNTRVYNFCYRAFPLDQFVKFLLKPGQINLVDSLVTVARLNTFLFVVSFGFSLIFILFGSNRAYRFLLSLLLRLMVSKYNFQNKHFK